MVFAIIIIFYSLWNCTQQKNPWGEGTKEGTDLGGQKCKEKEKKNHKLEKL